MASGTQVPDKGAVTTDRDHALDDLRRVAATRAFPLDAVPPLLAYVEEVLATSRSINLTAARDLAEAVRVLAWTALAVVPAWGRAGAPRLVADLGTGNGLPGVAAALAWPEAQVLLVERRRKKAAAVASCARAVGLDRVDVLAMDGREVLSRHPALAARVDLVTVRAVGPLGETTRIAAPWLRSGGIVAHWKGAGLTPAEVKEGRAAARAAGLRPSPDLAYDDPYGPARIVRYERPPAVHNEEE